MSLGQSKKGNMMVYVKSELYVEVIH